MLSFDKSRPWKSERFKFQHLEDNSTCWVTSYFLVSKSFVFLPWSVVVSGLASQSVRDSHTTPFLSISLAGSESHACLWEPSSSSSSSKLVVMLGGTQVKSSKKNIPFGGGKECERVSCLSFREMMVGEEPSRSSCSSPTSIHPTACLRAPLHQ